MMVKGDMLFKNRLTTFRSLTLVTSIIFGTLVTLFRWQMVDSLIDHILILSPRSIIFDNWMNQEDSEVKLYFWNWTNPEELRNRSRKPTFQEVGPVVYKMVSKKVDMVFNENQTISYKSLRNFFYDEDTSVSENATITSLDAVTVMLTKLSRSMNMFVKKFLSLTLSVNARSYHIAKTIKELMFDGYDDLLLKMGSSFNFGDFPKKIGWWYGLNNTADVEGVFNVGSGLGNTTANYLYYWNYGNKSGLGSKLGPVMPEFWPENVKPTKLLMFVGQFGHIFTFDFEKIITYEGIEAYKFVANKSFLDCVTENSDGTKEVTSYLECQNYGTFGLLMKGAEFYFSLPHFMYADSTYRTIINGMKPDEDLHSSYILVNPRTGVPLKAHVAMQMNVLLESDAAYRVFEDLPDVTIPIWWYQMEIELPEKFKHLLRALRWLPYVLLISSLLVIGVSSWKLMKILHSEEVKYNSSHKTSDEYDSVTVPLNSSVIEKKILPSQQYVDMEFCIPNTR